MDAAAFFTSLRDAEPPAGLSAPLAALWHDARGDWERAHATVQGSLNAAAARVHGYLHRKEGDLPNARYWYERAGVPSAQGTLAEEWRELVMTCLDPGAGRAALD